MSSPLPSCHVYRSSCISFSNVLEDSFHARCDQSNHPFFFFFTVCMIFLSSLTQSNTSSFLTRFVQLIFSILLQHYISKIFGYLFIFHSLFSVSFHSSFPLILIHNKPAYNVNRTQFWGVTEPPMM